MAHVFACLTTCRLDIENIDEIGGDIDFIQGSVADEDLLARVLEDVEVVFHEAAIPSVPRSVEAPRQTHIASVDGTFSLLLLLVTKKSDGLSTRLRVPRTGINPRFPSRKRCCPIRYRPMQSQNWSVNTIADLYASLWPGDGLLRYFNVFGPRQDRFAILRCRLQIY